MARNVALYPWFRFCSSLMFWQAVWFLYFQNQLSAAEAVLLYVVYDIATLALEVPSGFMSDRCGRRVTLLASAAAGLAGMLLLAIGDSFAAFAAAQGLMGASMAFASGTDSALLYESLAARGREGEIERQELRAWRFSFVALAVSAVTGGVMSLYAPALPFVGGAAALAGALVIALRFREPPQAGADIQQGAELVRLGSLRAALTQPVLVWLLALSVAMYMFSHIPFVFGQPFILEALKGLGWEGEAPLVSGSVTAAMMLVSVAVSVFAPGLRRRLGLAAVLLLAFVMQIGLTGVLAATNGAVAVALLMLRMAPDSLSKPFILARIQPLLRSDGRATYFSLQSLAGRIAFAATLFLASGVSSGTGQMAYGEIRQILTWYLAGGLVCFAGLALAATRVKLEG